MNNPLTMKLEQFTRFAPWECERLDQLLNGKVRVFQRGDVILRDGENVSSIVLVKSGLVVRSKTLSNGNRQTMAFLIPGDLCDVEVFVLDEMDHDLIALSETKCVFIPATQMREMLSQSTDLTRALWWSTMTDAAVLRERIVGHGTRDAREQIAHIFCELLIRYRMSGQTNDDSYPLSISQIDLAEATGLTSIHVNRTIKGLRTAKLIDWQRKRMRILNPAGLMEVAQFSPRYLHLTRARAGDANVAGQLGDLVGTKSAEGL